MYLKSNNWYFKLLGPLLSLTLALVIQIFSPLECAWLFPTLIIHHILLEMMNLCICSFSWFIPQIHFRSPNSMPPPTWGPPQYSQAGLVTLSSVFLLCLIWTSFIAFFTLSQKYAPCLSLELSFLAFLSHICVSSAWCTAHFWIGAIRRIVL